VQLAVVVSKAEADAWTVVDGRAVYAQLFAGVTEASTELLNVDPEHTQ